VPEKEPTIWQALSDQKEIVIAVAGTVLAAIGKAWHKLNGAASKTELAKVQEESRRELVDAQQAIYKKMDASGSRLHKKIEIFQSEAAKERRSDRQFLQDLFIAHTSTTTRRHDDQ